MSVKEMNKKYESLDPKVKEALNSDYECDYVVDSEGFPIVEDDSLESMSLEEYKEALKKHKESHSK